MDSDTLLADLARTLGLPTLQFNAQRVCRLMVDNRCEIDMECNPDGTVLTIYTSLGRALSSAICRELLTEAGKVGQETCGATFGLDADRDEILLAGTLPVANLTGAELATILESYVDVAARWTPRLSDVSGDQAVVAGATWTRV